MNEYEKRWKDHLRTPRVLDGTLYIKPGFRHRWGDHILHAGIFIVGIATLILVIFL